MAAIRLAMGALALLMSAGPALAGGYWDAGGPGRGDDAPAQYRDRDCDAPCPPCPDWREHGDRHEDRVWREGWGERGGWREGRQVFLPAEFFEGGGGVGPDIFIDDSGGGGGFVDDGAFAGARASAFASASASARVRISIHERGFFHHPMHHTMMRPMMKHGGHGHW